MSLDKEPFRMYSSEEEIKEKKAKSWTLSIRLNSKERTILQEVKKALNLHMDGTAIKACLLLSKNVIHGTLGSDLMSYLTSPLRRREILEDERKE